MSKRGWNPGDLVPSSRLFAFHCPASCIFQIIKVLLFSSKTIPLYISIDPYATFKSHPPTPNEEGNDILIKKEKKKTST